MNPATRSRAAALAASAGLLVGGAFSTAEALATSVTYTGSVVTDVSLGGQMLPKAHVTMIFKGRIEDVSAFQITDPNNNLNVFASGALITKGYTRVVIEQRGQTVTANVSPNQVFVSADTYNGGIGFGTNFPAQSGGQQPVYPMGFTIGSAGDYSQSFAYPDTSVLTTTVNLSGAAFSCIGYPATVPGCTDPTAYPISTDQGPLIVYQPYVAEKEGGHHGSMARGVFQIFVGSSDSD